VIFAAVVQKRLAFLQVERFDFADENGMVSGHILGHDVTAEMSEGIFEKRNTGRRPLEADTELHFFRGFLVGFRKKLGERPLGILKDVDAETALGPEIIEQAGGATDANENQQGIKGNGGQGVCGHAVDLAGFALGRNYSDACRKTAHDAAK
jgi:hypothetical protein